MPPRASPCLQVARPADQVISLAVEKDVKEGAAGADGTVDVEGLAGEVEADRVEYSEEDEEARIGGLVLEATKRGVVSVLDLMRKEADNPMFQWWCSDAIASLCAGNGEQDGDAAGCASPLEERWRGLEAALVANVFVDVRTHTLACLQSVHCCLSPPTVPDEARALAGASGAVELVVDAFKRFSGEETVVVKGCWAMAILAADHGKHARSSLVRPSARPPVLPVLPGDSCVCGPPPQQACWHWVCLALACPGAI